jgi:phage head maturation protease
MKERVILNGIIHKRFEELDDPLYYGGNIKPSEFDRMAEGFIGKDVFVEHEGEPIGKIFNSYTSKVTGHLMGDLEIDITKPKGIETIEKVRKGELRNLSFGAHVLRKKDPESKIIWESQLGAKEVSIVNNPAVPESFIKELKVVDEDGYEVSFREVYNSKQKQENNNKMQVDRPNPAPEDLGKIKMDAPAGGALARAIDAQAQQMQQGASGGVAGFQQHTQMVTPVPPSAATPILNMVEEQNKRQRLMEAEQYILQKEAELKKREDEINAKIKEDEEKIKKLEEETRKTQLRTQNAEKVAEAAKLFGPIEETLHLLTPEQQENHRAWKASILEAVALNQITPEIDATMGTIRASLNKAQSSLQLRNKEAEDYNKIKQAEKEERDRQVKEAMEKEKKIALLTSQIPNKSIQRSIYETLGMQTNQAPPPAVAPSPVTSPEQSNSIPEGMRKFGNFIIPVENKLTPEMELQSITASNLQRGNAAYTVFSPAAIWAENNPEGFINFKKGLGLTAAPYYTSGQLAKKNKQ